MVEVGNLKAAPTCRRLDLKLILSKTKRIPGALPHGICLLPLKKRHPSGCSTKLKCGSEDWNADHHIIASLSGGGGYPPQNGSMP